MRPLATVADMRLVAETHGAQLEGASLSRPICSSQAGALGVSAGWRTIRQATSVERRAVRSHGDSMHWPIGRLTSWVALLAAVCAVGIAAGTAMATEPSGLSSTEIAAGEFMAPVEVNFLDHDGDASAGTVSTIHLFRIVLQPGGTTGWHQHSGPGWAMVTAGTLTHYGGDDPLCRPAVYEAGSAFLEQEERTHIAFNRGDVPVELYAAFMLPPGGELRIDASAPGNCPF